MATKVWCVLVGKQIINRPYNDNGIWIDKHNHRSDLICLILLHFTRTIFTLYSFELLLNACNFCTDYSLIHAKNVTIKIVNTNQSVWIFVHIKPRRSCMSPLKNRKILKNELELVHKRFAIVWCEQISTRFHVSWEVFWLEHNVSNTCATFKWNCYKKNNKFHLKTITYPRVLNEESIRS